MFERALAELGKRSFNEQFFIQFTKFEIRQREYQRAKILYEYALENISKEHSKNLIEEYVTFQKQFGTRDDIEDVVLTQRRHQLEAEISKEPLNYDLWFDYCTLEEQANANVERSRSVF